MFPSLWLVALVHLLVALLTSANQAPYTIPDEQLAIWQSLCDNRAPLLLKHRSQIKALADSYETLYKNLHPSEAIFGCLDRIAPALGDLDQLIEENQHDVCSLKAVEGILDYFHVFISRPQDRSKEEQLPDALKNFFLGYGLQVSKTCKKNMIPTLEAIYKEMQLSGSPVEDNFVEKWREYTNLFSYHISENSAIGQLIKNPVDYDDLLLPRDIEQLVREEYGSEDDADDDDYNRIFMQTKSNDAVRVFKAICEKRYKAVYKQLLPLIYLSNIGFNYQSDELKHELNELRSRELIRQTYRMTFLCESLENIVLVDDPEFLRRNKDLQSSAMMRILSPAEAESLQRQNTGQNDDDERHKETRDLVEAIKEFVYVEQGYEVQIDGKILDDEDEDLMKMVLSFDAYKSESDRIKSRFIRKLKSSLISDLWQGKYTAIMSRAADIQTNNYLSADASLGNRQLIEAIDKHVDEVYNQEEAVSWYTQTRGYAKRVYYKQANLRKGGGYKRMLKRIAKKMRVRKPFWRCVAIILVIIAILCLVHVIG